MRHQIKRNRVRQAGLQGVYTPNHRTNMHITVNEIMAQIPDTLYARCTSADLIELCKAINDSYHNGRRSTGAERIDDTGIWLNKEQRIVDVGTLL